MCTKQMSIVAGAVYLSISLERKSRVLSDAQRYMMLKNKKISPCAYDLSVLERKGKLILPIIYGVEM